MRKIKILHVVSGITLGSGVMSVIMNYYRNINRDKIQFDFLYFRENENNYRDEILELGGKCILLEKPSIKSFNQYKSFFKENSHKYKAIHLHELYLNSILFPLAKKNGVKNLISHCHATRYSDKRINAIRNWILCLPLKKQANIYLSCSREAARRIYGNKVGNSNEVTIINNAINIEKFKFNEAMRRKIRSSLNLNDTFVLGHIGRFNEQKNHLFILDIFREIKKEIKHSKLMLVGDGPQMNLVKERAELLKIKDSVIFLGRKDNVQDYLHAMDHFVLPSLFEGLPVAGVEAQASGLPITMSENITQEIGLINYLYISLQKSSKFWANSIIEMNNRSIDRTNSWKEVQSQGFDIINESLKLEELYLNL